jgi:hypothetical protein
MDVGYVLQMGHNTRDCKNFEDSIRTLTVVDLTGIHLVNVRWCDCGESPGGSSQRAQLLRLNWFPTTAERPNTAITFDALEFFHLLTLQAKLTFYDFYETLLKRIDNSGLGQHPVSTLAEDESMLIVLLKDRYRECFRAFREWRHLKLLKRHGRGYFKNGIEATSAGSCAVECPACPQPGRNLPENWRECPPELRCVLDRILSCNQYLHIPLLSRFLYVLMLSLDANFRLKSKERGIKDVRLGDGYAYLVEEGKFKSHIAASSHAVEVGWCFKLVQKSDQHCSR